MVHRGEHSSVVVERHQIGDGGLLRGRVLDEMAHDKCS